MRRWRLAVTFTLAAALGMNTAPAEEDRNMELSSTAFSRGETIPARFTCEGDEVSPPLAWSGLPEGTKSLALIVDDPDAPDPRAPKVTWVHWVVFNLPPQAGGLQEGASPDAMPEGAGQGLNSWDRTGYGGPCPPVGEHRYFHKLYALDTRLDLERPDKDTLIRAMEGHVLDRTELMGTYRK